MPNVLVPAWADALFSSGMVYSRTMPGVVVLHDVGGMSQDHPS
jgi:hypothetical protein